MAQTRPDPSGAGMGGFSLGGCSGLPIYATLPDRGGRRMGRDRLSCTLNSLPRGFLGKWVWLTGKIHSSRSSLAYSIKTGGSAQEVVTSQEKVLATKPDDFSSVPETHKVEEERTKPTPKILF